jgi:hypothetical protein
MRKEASKKNNDDGSTQQQQAAEGVQEKHICTWYTHSTHTQNVRATSREGGDEEVGRDGDGGGGAEADESARQRKRQREREREYDQITSRAHSRARAETTHGANGEASTLRHA